MAKLRELFGKRLEELLKQNKMKQCEFAAKIDIDAQSISRMIAGKHFPKEENLEKMIQVLNVEPHTMFKFTHMANDTELINDINRLIKNAPSQKVRLAHRLIAALFDES
ncbi:helix-turn-helix transcriptional regulator [bacterium]|nr:helix-turn-helix transcriptional regulator [bacterium]